jgi:hypothetical protein
MSGIRFQGHHVFQSGQLGGIRSGMFHEALGKAKATGGLTSMEFDNGVTRVKSSEDEAGRKVDTLLQQYAEMIRETVLTRVPGRENSEARQIEGFYTFEP